MLSTNTTFTAGVELEYKCSIGYQEMHRRLQAAGFTWAKAIYDGRRRRHRNHFRADAG